MKYPFKLNFVVIFFMLLSLVNLANEILSLLKDSNDSLRDVTLLFLFVSRFVKGKSTVE